MIKTNVQEDCFRISMFRLSSLPVVGIMFRAISRMFGLTLLDSTRTTVQYRYVRTSTQHASPSCGNIIRSSDYQTITELQIVILVLAIYSFSVSVINMALLRSCCLLMKQGIPRSQVGSSIRNLHNPSIRTNKLPRRIILIRHGESLGNVDYSSYASIPDWKIPLTRRGERQAAHAAEKLHELIKGETLFTYCRYGCKMK
jgi:hypothetical protein